MASPGEAADGGPVESGAGAVALGIGGIGAAADGPGEPAGRSLLTVLNTKPITAAPTPAAAAITHPGDRDGARAAVMAGEGLAAEDAGAGIGAVPEATRAPVAGFS